MPDDDWYRSSRWTEADREAFEARLARARPHNRAQYVRLKALALAESTDDRERSAAGELLERVIRDYDDDRLQSAMARSDLARWYEQQGDDASAAEAYRSCLAAERALGSLHTGAELALAELIVRSQSDHEHVEALRLLDEALSAGLTFKSERWRWHVARARLAVRMGDRAAAASAAAVALALLDDERPDFSRHPDVGLINPDDATVSEMRSLTDAHNRSTK